MDNFVFICVMVVCVAVSSCMSYMSLRNLTNPEIYNRSDLPPTVSIRGMKMPVKITVKFRIDDLTLREENNEYVFHIKLRIYAQWYDERLTFPSSDPHFSLLDGNQLIWYPSLAFICEISEIDKWGENKWSARIHQDGTVHSFTKMSVSVPAEIRDFTVEGFRLKFISVNYTATDLTLMWLGENSIELADHLTWDYIPVDLTAEDIETETCISYGLAQIDGFKGNRSCLQLKASNQMETSEVLMVYLPATLCVVLTWVSFWMRSCDVLARCLPPLISLIHLINQKTCIMKSTLIVQNALRLNIWLHICVGFSLTSMVQAVCVTYIFNFSMLNFRADSTEEGPTILMTREREEDRKSIEESEPKDTRTHPYEKKLFRRLFPSFSRETAADDLNAISRWLFPLSFVLLLIGFCVLDF